MTETPRIPPTPKPLRVLAIDPGYEQSAYVVYETVSVGPLAPAGRIVRFGIVANDDLLPQLRDGSLSAHCHAALIERIESYGMAVGREVFDTVWWAGRFAEAVPRTIPVLQIPRREVKVAICGDSRAKDANIRAALIDRWGGPAAGRKGGALAGVSKDVWAALAIAVTWAEAGRRPAAEGAAA